MDSLNEIGKVEIPESETAKESALEEIKADLKAETVETDSKPEPEKEVPKKAKKASKKAKEVKADNRESESVSAFDLSLRVRENSARRNVEPKTLRTDSEGLKDSPYRSEARNNTFRIAFALSLKGKISRNVRKKFPKVVEIRERLKAKGIEVGKGYSRSDISVSGKALRLKVTPSFVGVGPGSTRFSVEKNSETGKAFLTYPGETNSKSDRPE